MKKLFSLFTLILALFVNANVFSQELCSIEDAVKFHNLMKGCSSQLTNEAKSNYERVRPSIVEIAQKYGFSIYEYHYVNGNLGDGELSSYCCYLYKNCQLKKGDSGYPTFTPTKGGVSCLIESSGITVYSRNSYNQLVNMIKKICGNTLYTYSEGDESHFYSDGKLCYFVEPYYPYSISIQEMTSYYKEAMSRLTLQDLLSIYNKKDKAYAAKLLKDKGYVAKGNGWTKGKLRITYDGKKVTAHAVEEWDDPFPEEWYNELKRLKYRCEEGQAGMCYWQDYTKPGMPEIVMATARDHWAFTVGGEAELE